MKARQSRKGQKKKKSVGRVTAKTANNYKANPGSQDQVSVFSEPQGFLLGASRSKKPASGFTASATIAILNAMKARGLLPAASIILSISYVNPSKMKQINGQFRGKTKATDILSFEQSKWTGDLPFHFLGDLVICNQVLKAQAKEMGHSPFQECLVLLVHGCLHLLGFDHEQSKSKAATMCRLERKILEDVILVLNQNQPQKLVKSWGLDTIGAGLIDRSQLFSGDYGKKRNRTSF